ncbi:uncharacterized protein LOC9634447 [Selaginella moellendorffii]|nr:uncharacterized protein LOC9634447 [Selaginella moellendorffii]|eukprot:XP_002991053.2 uncharacterized protein LOC9634447 [Selaginella moellendorffii]
MDGFAGILALLLASIAATGSDASSYGLDTVLAQEFKADPLAGNDTFELLRPGLKHFLSTPRHDLDYKLHSILSLQSTTPVTVKLVGFSSDQKHQLEQQLGRYLEILNKNEHVHVIGTGGTSNHRLNVRSKIEIDVVRDSGSSNLADSMFRAIQGIVDRPSSLSSVYYAPVPYTVVDELVRADLAKPLASYVIYILNLKRQARSYGYDYQPGDGDELHSAFTKCLGNLWMGRERYVWIDLAAGPIEYGPALSGEGLVLRSELYPYAAAFHESPAQKALLADLAALVWSASQMLLAPAMRIPVYYDRELEVHFFHFKHVDGGDSEQIKWEEIEETFRKEASEGLLFHGQSLVFKRFTIDMDECALCSALLARSTKSYTSRVLIDRYSLFVNDYIDSKQLHYLLAENQAELEKMAGSSGSSNNFMARIVPVYVFDLKSDRIVMLDRDHQSMAFRDMIIAIRSKGYQTVSEFNCNHRPMMVETRRLERPLVASLLQTLWGVTPTYLTWSSEHNSTFLDYTWSLGNTPFGPFSKLSSLSFAQRDAAPRNVLHTMLNTTVWGAIEMLETLKGLGGEKAVLKSRQGTEMNQRWNLLLYKLNKATSAMSHFDFNLALFFLKSAEHDLYGALGFANGQCYQSSFLFFLQYNKIQYFMGLVCPFDWS